MKPLIFVLSLVCAALAAQLILRNGTGSRNEVAAAHTRAIALSNDTPRQRTCRRDQ
jgi:hypothetical protein